MMRANAQGKRNEQTPIDARSSCEKLTTTSATMYEQVDIVIELTANHERTRAGETRRSLHLFSRQNIYTLQMRVKSMNTRLSASITDQLTEPFMNIITPVSIATNGKTEITGQDLQRLVPSTAAIHRDDATPVDERTNEILGEVIIRDTQWREIPHQALAVWPLTKPKRTIVRSG